MKKFIVIMLNGDCLVAEGETIASAVGTPAGIDFYIEVNQKVTIGSRKKFNRVHNVTVNYVYHSLLGYVVADVTPYPYDYNEFSGKKFTKKEDMIESIVKYLEEKGWKL